MLVEEWADERLLGERVLVWELWGGFIFEELLLWIAVLVFW